MSCWWLEIILFRLKYTSITKHTPLPPNSVYLFPFFHLFLQLIKFVFCFPPVELNTGTTTVSFICTGKWMRFFLRVLNTKFSWLLQQFYQNRLFVGFAESMKNWTMFHFQLTLSTFHFEPYFCYFSFSSFFFLFKL